MALVMKRRSRRKEERRGLKDVVIAVAQAIAAVAALVTAFLK
jgi:hypothetical protein